MLCNIEGRPELRFSQPFFQAANRKLFKQIVRNIIYNANNKVLEDHVTGNAQLISARDGIYNSKQIIIRRLLYIRR